MTTTTTRHARALRLALPAGALLLAACGSSSPSAAPGADASADVAKGAHDSAAEASPRRNAGSPRNDAAADAGSRDAGSDGAPLDAVAETTVPPSDAARDAAPACVPRTFAIETLQFGDGNSGQWKALGFNIDGLTSVATDTNLCQPSSGASAAQVYPDGDDGIDNSFGENLLPLLLDVDPTLVADTNGALQSGTFSNLFEASCLPTVGDVPSVPTKLFVATALGSTPKFDGTDVWPVAPEYLSDPTNPDSSTLAFASATVTGTRFDSGKNQTFVLRIPVTASGTTTWMTFTLYAAEVQMTFSADRTTATGGVIGGVLKTADVVVEIEKLGDALNLCNSSVLASLVTAVEQASDILASGTQDPTQTCDGISIGLGFTLAEAQRGSVGVALAVEPACATN